MYGVYGVLYGALREVCQLPTHLPYPTNCYAPPGMAAGSSLSYVKYC